MVNGMMNKNPFATASEVDTIASMRRRSALDQVLRGDPETNE
jgi:hypothetical protein